MKNQPDDFKFGFTNKAESIEEYLETEDEMVLQNENFIIGFNLFEKD